MGLVMEGFRELQVFEIGLNCLKGAEEEALLYADPGCLNGGILCDVTPQFHFSQVSGVTLLLEMMH